MDVDDAFGRSMSSDDVARMKETLRGNVKDQLSPQVSWLDSWAHLVATIRGAPCPVFWKMFSGTSGLTREFLRRGWVCAPPIDVLYVSEFYMLNPCFVCVVLGLIRERRVRALHVGPPCASFIMAVNRSYVRDAFQGRAWRFP